jgi:hypothetical protein
LNPGFSVFGWYLIDCDAQRRYELSAAVKRRNSGDRQVSASARDYRGVGADAGSAVIAEDQRLFFDPWQRVGTRNGFGDQMVMRRQIADGIGVGGITR